MRGLWLPIFLGCLWFIVCGCATRSRIETRPQTITYVSKPVIDFGRGGGGLPLEGLKELASAEDLMATLTRGFDARIELPRDRQTVTMSGEFPNLELLKVDLSNTSLRKEYKPRELKKPSAPQAAVFAKQFEYVARPLKYQDGPMEWHITAKDAELSLIRDGEKGSLILTNASEGSFEFAMKVENIRPMLLAGAKAHAKGGFAVRDVAISARCENEQSLLVEMKVDATWMLLPATFRIRGRIDIDESFNVCLSGLGCEGRDLGGLLLAGFINDAMQKHNGKLMPLAQWPGDRIRLSGAKISLDDQIRVKAAFGPAPRVAQQDEIQPSAVKEN
jgi:hypothetical protein